MAGIKDCTVAKRKSLVFLRLHATGHKNPCGRITLIGGRTMKSDKPTSRIEWVFLGLSLFLGIGALVLTMFVPHDVRTGPIILPLAAAGCGILAVLFLGLHMVFRFRRKMARRERLKKEMADILT
jgi:hypothetical protein